jgi:putative phosphoesterase
MRIIIFSDLHANLEALAALRTVEKLPDAILFLGDIVGYGPEPAACVAWVRANVQYAVQGDHDRATATKNDFSTPAEYRELAVATRDHSLRQLKLADRAFLGNLPPTLKVELGGARFVLAHGSPRDPFGPGLDIATAPENTLRTELEGVDADIVLLGHTHVPALRRVGNVHLVNPGSLGQPRHGLPSATFAAWEDGRLQIHHIDYDPKPTINKLNLLALDPEVTERLQELLEKGI